MFVHPSLDAQNHELFWHMSTLCFIKQSCLKKSQLTIKLKLHATPYVAFSKPCYFYLKNENMHTFIKFLLTQSIFHNLSKIGFFPSHFQTLLLIWLVHIHTTTFFWSTILLINFFGCIWPLLLLLENYHILKEWLMQVHHQLQLLQHLGSNFIFKPS